MNELSAVIAKLADIANRIPAALAEAEARGVSAGKAQAEGEHTDQLEQIISAVSAVSSAIPNPSPV